MNVTVGCSGPITPVAEAGGASGKGDAKARRRFYQSD